MDNCRQRSCPAATAATDRVRLRLPGLVAVLAAMTVTALLLLSAAISVGATATATAAATSTATARDIRDVNGSRLQRRHATNRATNEHLVVVNKCCERFEIHVDSACTLVNETDYFEPIFMSYRGEHNIPVKFKFVIGIPACGSMQNWPISHYKDSVFDKLVLLEDGKLRHYTHTDEVRFDEPGGDHDHEFDEEKKPLFYDYAQGQYCIDKGVSTSVEQHSHFLYASICLPKQEIKWTDTSFLVRKIVNPFFHGISLIILLIIAIIYFILPTLRDLVGNIVTTIAVCLMISQVADLVRIFTELTNHVSFIVADIVLYISLLGAFFWLNSFGYYIWKTFRSRNVFLRVTDGRKYCYYSVYVWGMTGVLAIMAVFAHFFLDAEKQQNQIADQETVGWLGIAIFFAPVACTILVDVFFYVTTLKLINRRNVYGRIQHKLKANFVMFSLLLLVMTITWIFLVLSWLQYDGLLYAHIIFNALQSPMILYICILRQKHVTFLLKKSCCYNEPPSTNDWGNEMHYINYNDY